MFGLSCFFLLIYISINLQIMQVIPLLNLAALLYIPHPFLHTGSVKLTKLMSMLLDDIVFDCEVFQM